MSLEIKQSYSGKYIGDREELINFQQELRKSQMNYYRQVNNIFLGEGRKWNHKSIERGELIKNQFNEFTEYIDKYEDELLIIDDTNENLDIRRDINSCFQIMRDIKWFFKIMIASYALINGSKKNRLPQLARLQLYDYYKKGLIVAITNHKGLEWDIEYHNNRTTNKKFMDNLYG